MKTKVEGIVQNGIREAFILERIQESGMTKAEVAECVGIPPSTLNTMLRRGIAGSSLDSVARICDVLDIDLNSLVHGEIPDSSALYIQRANMSHRIYETRVKLRYRRGAVADHIGISESIYRDMEGGLWLISDNHIRQLALLFDVSIDYLYCRTDTAPAITAKLFEPSFDKNNDPYNYGLGIKTLREKLQISRLDFATQIGVDIDLLSDWEDNIRIPWPHELANIATTFSVLPGTLCSSREHRIYTEEIAQLVSGYENANKRDQLLIRTILGIDTPPFST